MGTTLMVDDNVLQAARNLASEQDMSLGRALSELARRGMRTREPKREKGLPMFDVASDAAPIIPEMVREALDER